MPDFTLGRNVAENVKALRVALGSVVVELSQAKLAALIDAKHETRDISASQIQRWESGVEPDYRSVEIMADLARVSFEAFAIGNRAVLPVDPDTVKPAATSRTAKRRKSK